MAARASKKPRSPSPDPNGMFHGMVVFLVERGVQPRRLQIWKQKLIQMGAAIVDGFTRRVTHVFAVNSAVLLEQVNNEYLQRYQGHILRYEWLENCLKSGEKVAEDPYLLSFQDVQTPRKKTPEPSDDDSPDSKKIKLSHDDLKIELANSQESQKKAKQNESVQLGNHGTGVYVQEPSIEKGPKHDIDIQNGSELIKSVTDASAVSNEANASQESSPYSPPNLNRNITEIFGKLIDIYRALGDERRSFSYYKAISAIEKLPFKIENINQVKHVPSIGKGLQDHIHEIITTGKLSKLEHFENDEKVRAVSLFGEVWGIGPATAVKLYEKGHRTLDDLRHDGSLTNAQKIGLQYFDDIKKRIPRHEVKDMELLLQKVGQEMLPGVLIVCGGSYRRGKASCGDLDIVITHPDGKSHKGFLTRYVQYLKDINFLREDLVFSIHSIEETDSGVDTYFGLCTYPGQETRHRIDFKVYPRDIYAFGLIAWTGNDVLNRRLRLLADSKGYRLDDTGLYLTSWSSDKKRGTKSSNRVTCYTEKEVFDLLGFPWLEPHERNL